MISLIVTRGYSNSSITGSIAAVVTRGYTIGGVVPPSPTGSVDRPGGFAVMRAALGL